MSTQFETAEKSKFAQMLEEQMTPRTQYGLVVLFFLAMLYGISSLMGYVSARASEAQSLQSELEIWSDTDAQNEWRARAQTTAEALTQWEGAAWQAASPGIAAAEIEIAIQGITGTANIPAARVDVSAEASGQQTEFLRFDVSGDVPIGSIPRLLILFASNSKQLIVTDVQLVTRNQTSTNFQISGVAPFKRVTEGDAP